MVRFEYFQDRFAQEADQEWTYIELDELYQMDYLFSSQGPYIIAKNLKCCQKTNRTQKNLDWFAPEADHSGPRMDLGRTRWALSDVLLIFFLTPFCHGEKPEILPQPWKLRVPQNSDQVALSWMRVPRNSWFSRIFLNNRIFLPFPYFCETRSKRECWSV